MGGRMAEISPAVSIHWRIRAGRVVVSWPRKLSADQARRVRSFGFAPQSGREAVRPRKMSGGENVGIEAARQLVWEMAGR